jgi:Tol biopolymer transport system component
MDHEPPPLTTIQPMTPPALDRVVRTCLAKDAEDRWQTAHDVRLQLQTISSTEAATVASTTRPRRHVRELIAWALAVVGLTAAVIAVRSQRDGVTAPVRLSILPPEGMSFPESIGVAISPDGKYLAYTAPSAGADSMLWIRPIASLRANSLAETEGATFPFWSPDGRSIGFFAEGRLKRIAATGGGMQSLCDAPAGRGGSWNAEDEIIFAPSVQSRLHRVSASGGECSALKTSEPSGPVLTHRWPWFLPDGRTFLFYAGSPGARTGIYVSSLDRADAKFIVDANSRVAYATSGYLLFVREGSLIAQPFDLDKLQLRQKPSVIAERVAVTQGLNYGDFSVSSNGIVAFKESGLTNSQAIWFDRKGNPTGSVGDPGLIGSIRLSPEGTRLLLTRRDLRTQVGDIWLEELSRQAPQRITFDNETHIGVAWSPDGKEIIYGKGGGGRPFDVYRLSLLDSGGPQEFLASPSIENPNDWSGDGRYIVLQQVRKTRWDLILARSDGTSPPIPWLATPFDEVSAQFSPDGKWIAYASNESGRYEIYVRPFPGPGAAIRVSVHGGRAPVWRRDGREVFFLSREDSLMAAPLTNGSPIKPGPPVRLFPTKVVPSLPGTSSVFEVSRDGQQFLINTRVGPDEPKRINLLLNWASELSERE